MDPKKLEALVQQLLDAGASEDEINTVIDEYSAAPPTQDESGVGGMLAGGAAAAGAVGLGLAAKKYGLGAVFDTLNNARRQGMLTGLAIPKSLLGNLGAGITESVERGSIAPIKEMLRLPTNVKNAVTAFSEAAPYEGQQVSKWAIPGRILGATDKAATQALERAGVSAEDAAKTMLQSPVDLGPQLGKALNTPLGQYLVPFRRTPVNQFTGGFETMAGEGAWSGPGKVIANAGALGGGFATGYETEGKAPTVAGTALMGRRGLPFAGAAMLGRLAAGESGRSAADLMQGASPVSDYSLSEGVAGPFVGKVPKPAILKLLGIVE